MNPFDYVNAVTYTKKKIMVDDIAEKEYAPFIVNKALGNFRDTVLYANEMNINHHLDHRLQFDFFINIVKKQKRWSKWVKPESVSDLELIKEYYGYSNEKAKSVLPLLSYEYINKLKLRIYKGGKRN